MENKDLPIIKIIEFRDVMYSEMDLEMGDNTHSMLADWGRDIATDADFINIAIREGLENYIKNLEEGKKDGADAERVDED
jgi:hypothetical protein